MPSGFGATWSLRPSAERKLCLKSIRNPTWADKVTPPEVHQNGGLLEFEITDRRGARSFGGHSFRGTVAKRVALLSE